MTGYVHSLQSLGAVDGPGLRFTVFLQGCRLRCVFCHNPDTWEEKKGTAYTPEVLMEQILRYTSYFGEKGGVTVSGGEPLLQADFVSELFSLCRKNGIHTALDTSGIGDLTLADKLLSFTDLVLCDLKFETEERYHEKCRASLAQVCKFLALTEEKKIPLWIRHVVIPNLTDSKEEIQQIAALVRSYSNLEKIELLPFRKLCQSKYDAMGIPFPLSDIPECKETRLVELKKILEA